jgi:glycosyltransferase involved in cell wall biosynthesis
MVWEADRVSLSEAKRIFTNSVNVQTRLWNSLRISSEPLYHPSPMSERLLGMEPGPYGDAVVFPSRFESLKRQNLVVDAMKLVQTDVKLLLVGRGPDEEALRSQIEDLGVADRVFIEVGPSDERLMELLLNALAVYYGPFDEDFGYVTLEGFAARRPVITLTDSGGPLEFVSDGQTGLVVPPGPRAIAAAFDRLYEDRRLAERLGGAGHDRTASEIPSWAEIVARLLS